MNTATPLRPLVITLLCIASLAASACGGAESQSAARGRSNAGAGGRDSSRDAKRTNAAGRSSDSDKGGQPDESGRSYSEPTRLAELENKSISESSGLAASRRNGELFWTHNDSGGGAFLYAFDRRGRHRGVWKVTGAQSRDWEDMAAGPGPGGGGRSFLYIGDIGDNSERREEIVVYRVAEPTVTTRDQTSTKSKPRATERAEAIRLRYPDGSHDAETLLVHPQNGDLYIMTKTRIGASVVYKAKAPLKASSHATALTRVGEVSVPALLFGGFLTGGSLSPDGRRVILCDYFNGYELVLPEATPLSDFDDIWQQPASIVAIGARQQGEAVCYGTDGRAVYATSERLPAPLFETRRGRGAKR